MTRRLGLFVFSAALSFAGASHASDTPDEARLAVGGDVHLLVPIGEFARGNAPMLGPLLRVGYRVVPPLEITLRGGYLFGFGKQQGNVTTNFSILPIWVGLRYFVMEPGVGPYGTAEVGANYGRGRAEGTVLGHVIDDESDESRFGFNAGAGYVLSRALPIDLRAQFTYLNVVGRKTDAEQAAFALGFSAGYTASF